MSFTKIGKLSEFEPGKGTVTKVGDKSILVLNVGDKYFAVDEACPHSRGPLSDGLIDQDNLTITCTWHGAKFSLESGAGISGPCLNGVRCYQTQVSGDDLEIQV